MTKKSDKAVKKSLTASAETFGRMVHAGPLIVPLNQRPWSWTDNELGELVSDIFETTDRCSHVDGNDRWTSDGLPARPLPHFFGPFVLEETEAGREVVDGQQRLTAVTMFIAAMRDVNEEYCNTASHEAKTAARALRTGLDNWLSADGASGSSHERLQLDATVRDFFSRYVIQSTTSDERVAALAAHPLETMDLDSVQSKIVEAWQYIDAALRANLELSDHTTTALRVVTRLGEMFRVIQEVFTVITIVVTREGLSPALFRGLNARGTGLTDADKIKNELFITAPDREYLAIKRAWDEMASVTPGHDLESFLRNRYIIYHGFVQAQDLYTATKDVELATARPLAAVRSWAQDAKLAQAVSGTTRNAAMSQETQRHLIDIAAMGHSYVRPLLLAGAKAFFGKDDQAFATIVRLARNLAFRRVTMKMSQPETLLKNIAPICQRIGKNGDLATAVADIAKLSPDRPFVDKFAEFATATAGVQYYVLYELELAAGGAGSWVPAPHAPDYETPGTNVEHILSQQLSKTRTSEFEAWRDKRDRTKKDDDRFRKYVNRIANLLLLEKDFNGEFGDYDAVAKFTGDYPGTAVRLRGSGGARPQELHGQQVAAGCTLVGAAWHWAVAS